LRKRGFSGGFTAVYSDEQLPRREEIEVACSSRLCLCANAHNAAGIDWCGSKKVINGSAVTVTASAGMILASLVLRDISGGA
jgi:tRNA A37 threonylcarbamoyladenosine dehydratase